MANLSRPSGLKELPIRPYSTWSALGYFFFVRQSAVFYFNVGDRHQKTKQTTTIDTVHGLIGLYELCSYYYGWHWVGKEKREATPDRWWVETPKDIKYLKLNHCYRTKLVFNVSRPQKRKKTKKKEMLV